MSLMWSLEHPQSGSKAITHHATLINYPLALGHGMERVSSRELH